MPQADPPADQSGCKPVRNRRPSQRAVTAEAGGEAIAVKARVREEDGDLPATGVNQPQIIHDGGALYYAPGGRGVAIMNFVFE